MNFRNLLGFSLAMFLTLGSAYGANETLCKTSLQQRIPPVAKKIMSHLDNLEKDLKSIHSADDLRVYLADPREGGKDGRKQVFLLEAFGPILRGYKKSEDVREPMREIIDNHFKVIEDEMGQYSEQVELQKAAEAYGFDQAFIKELELGVSKALNQLFKTMTQEGWIGESKTQFRDIREDIEAIEWPETAMRDHKLLYRALRDMFEVFDEKMSDELKPMIEARSWTFEENMEEGLHEMRRILRWVTLSMQTFPEAFSYTHALDANKLKLKGLALEMAKAELEKNLERKTSMIEFQVARKGTLTVSPESTFLISALVDRLGRLKGKSEVYFKMQDAIVRYLKTHERLGTLNQQSTRQDIQKFVIEASSTARDSLKLTDAFVPGDKDPFHLIRAQTLEVLKPFWTHEPLVEFQDAAENAKDYWKQQE